MQKTQPKISEILHLAADKYLWDGDWCSYSGHCVVQSCVAVSCTCSHLDIPLIYEEEIFEGLKNMGLKFMSRHEFDEFPEGEKRQAARYVWLKFAAMIAEEQGL